MIVTLRFARGIALGLAAGGLLGVSTATAGEGSADIGPQPAYGHFAGERGPPAGAYGRSAPYGSPDQRAGRTTQQKRSRR